MQGVDHEGCGCAASEYGCCPDGNSTATGVNFAGCEDQDLPVAPPDVCGLEKDRGPNRDFVVRWSFDMEYGGCTRFWWGGEGGNRNNFLTKEECNQVCVDPMGKAVIFSFFPFFVKYFHFAIQGLRAAPGAGPL